MQNQAAKTRDMYMRMAREARTAKRNEGTIDFGAVRFYQSVEYYVQQARRYNLRLVRF